ncbi:MAG: ABC transporter ATP-binding protein [Candidatus Saccharimonadales bacterium]
MSNQVAIQVNGVSKTFRIPLEGSNGLKQKLINYIKGRRGYREFSPLNNISLTIEKGDFFGIVGRNGSGKSTLLKVLAGIYTPNRGGVVINGTLVPFIELGVGFNPELTGKENVFLNGALLGFSRKEIETMYESIVEFAELGEFMDERLKNYSSGMQVRLAFSIAIRARADILLLDEVLAVGDEAFQQKCYDYFDSLKKKKQTVIIVTHDMSSVRRFCNKAILIKDGEIICSGNPRLVADKYSDINTVSEDKTKEKTDIVEAVKPKYLTTNIVNGSRFNTNDSMIVKVIWENLQNTIFESVGINIYKQTGEHITGINSRTGNLPLDWKLKNEIELQLDLNIGSGKYFLEINLFEKEGKILDAIYNGPEFTIVNSKPTWSGMTELKHEWINKN